MKKGATGQSFIRKEVTSCKIHTLIVLLGKNQPFQLLKTYKIDGFPFITPGDNLNFALLNLDSCLNPFF